MSEGLQPENPYQASDVPPEAPPETPAGPTSDECNLGMLCHLLSLAAFVIPFGNIVGPLIIWLTKKDESEYVNYHGVQSLNFQITVTIASFLFVPVFVLSIILPPLFILLFFAIMAIGIGFLVFAIIAALAAQKGEYYKYPFSFSFLKTGEAEQNANA